MRAHKAFPVGLYGLLLGALCWLAVPELSAPVERAVLGALGWTVRAHAAVTGAPVHAAAMPVDEAAVARLRADLDERLRRSAFAGGRRLLPLVWQPVLCRVTALEVPGGGGAFSELRLDHSYADLAGCGPLVTRGESLVGFLCEPGIGVAQDDRPADAARVLLLNHRVGAAVPAVLLPAGDRPADEGARAALRFVIEPGAAVDPAPLRTALWDDPYLASRLDRSGQEVRTLGLPSGDREVPAGLLLGRARVWGYESFGETLPIGVYVEPAVDYRALSHVVLWQTGGVEPPAPAALTTAAMRLWPLPGSGGSRWHLTALAGPGVALPAEAAVVRDGMCLGTCRGLQFGVALGWSFASRQRRWALLLLPDDPQEPPRELLGTVVAGVGEEALVRLASGALAAGHAGFLFTGSNGPHCPPGLLIGRAEPRADGLLRVRLPPGRAEAAVAVIGGGG